MSINNGINLLNYTIQKKAAEAGENTDAAETESNNKCSVIAAYNDESDISFNDNYIFGTKTDDEIVSYVDSLQAANDNKAIDSSNSVLYTYDEKEAQTFGSLTNIKSKIFQYRHPQVTLNLYKNNFDEICNMLGVDATHGLKKSDLYANTQKDALEDANNDFFGALSRAFADKKNDEYISYKELQILFMRMSGTDCKLNSLEDYKNVVNNYAHEINEKYEALSPQGKLEYAIDTAREYFVAAGKDIFVQALDRLVNETGTKNTYGSSQICNVGQIAIASSALAEGQGGGYQYRGWAVSQTDINGANGTGNYQAFVFKSDYDTPPDNPSNKRDRGITFANETVNYNWIAMTAILVHELIHSSFYYFTDLSDLTSFKPSAQGLEELAKRGIITQTEKQNYQNNWDSGNITQEEFNRLFYLINTYCGEYNAYYQQANYLDYFGTDVFGNSGYNWLAVDESQEIGAVENFVSTNALYDGSSEDGYKEPKPLNLRLYA